MLLKMWYGVVSTYKWNHKYNKDRDDDAMVNWIEFWKTSYWHAIARRQEGFNDTYPRRKVNRYNVAHIWELTENRYHYPSVYAIIDWDLLGTNKYYKKLKRAFELYELCSRIIWTTVKEWWDANVFDMAFDELRDKYLNRISDTKNFVGNLVI